MAKFIIDPDDKSVVTTLRICIRDACVKGGAGVLIGTILSTFLLNRQRWPIIVGLGIGTGYAWAHCQVICGYGYLEHH